MPGYNSFEIYAELQEPEVNTLQWKIRTEGCATPSISEHYGYAFPCPVPSLMDPNANGPSDIHQTTGFSEDGQTDESEVAQIDANLVQVNQNSVKNITDDWQVHLFPNPANNSIWLQTENVNGPVNLELFNSLGRIVYAQSYEMVSEEKLRLDISNYNPGLLLVKVYYGEESKILKVIKN